MRMYGKIAAVGLAVMMTAQSASACTTIFAGADMTAEGHVMFARSEDLSGSVNKLFNVVPAGLHKEGEVYEGCFGFSWTFTHDSYGYTAFRDDNGSGICPDCGSSHPHTPYEEAGTNEKGLTVTCTETLHASEAAVAFDPYEEAGIEEAEMVTILLGEAASAREAVDLILNIYDTSGANNGSGILIADSKETWYIENVTGHQYIALKLAPETVFVEPNMSIIGRIDLDDTENVIASADLIRTAQDGGFFAGDADANVIDYVSSYNPYQRANRRMKEALVYLAPELYSDQAYEPAAELYTLTNVGEDGRVVPVHSGILLTDKLTVGDFRDFYKLPEIGSPRNQETHIFEITSPDALGTVEWIAMNDARIGVYVPYYPMLTTDVDASYKISTETASFSEEKPDAGLSFQSTVEVWEDGKEKRGDGWTSLPVGWDSSYYWTMDALANVVNSGEMAQEWETEVYARVEEMQNEINMEFTELRSEITLMSDTEEMQRTATDWSMSHAQAVRETVLELIEE